jgi:hypothetical protein
VEEFSLPRVQKALESFLTRQRFFPHPSQIREVLESMMAKERRDELAANRYAPDPNAITSLVDCSGAQRVEWPAAIAGNDGSTACPDSEFPRYQGPLEVPRPGKRSA